jgi:hypothetical protein
MNSSSGSACLSARGCACRPSFSVPPVKILCRVIFSVYAALPERIPFTVVAHFIRRRAYVAGSVCSTGVRSVSGLDQLVCVGVAYKSANYKCDYCDVPGDDSGARTTIFCLLIIVFVYVSFLLGKKNFFVYCHVDLLSVVCTRDRDLPVNFRYFCGPS